MKIHSGLDQWFALADSSYIAGAARPCNLEGLWQARLEPQQILVKLLALDNVFHSNILL